VHCSSIHFNLSTSCSAALSSNRAFSSSEFISPRHDETEKEASHAFLQAVDYHNYMLDGAVAQPMFGLGVEKTVSLVNELLKYPASVGVRLCKTEALTDYACQSFSTYVGMVSSAFELEGVPTRSGRSTLLESFDNFENTQLIMVILNFTHWNLLITQQYPQRTLLMDEPLLPLSGDIIAQYRSRCLGCPRMDNERLL
jgi:hypothetical protein